MIIVHSKAREMKDRRRADGVVIKNSAKVLTTHGPKSTELFLGKVKTYSWIPNNRVYTQPYFENFPRYTVLFGTYTKPPSQALRR